MDDLMPIDHQAFRNHHLSLRMGYVYASSYALLLDGTEVKGKGVRSRRFVVQDDAGREVVIDVKVSPLRSSFTVQIGSTAVRLGRIPLTMDARARALFLDYWIVLLLAAVVFLVYMYMLYIFHFMMLALGWDVVRELKEIAAPVAYALMLCAAWLYNAGLESSKRQATLGKSIAKLEVTDLTGNRVSFGRATARFFAKLILGVVLVVSFLFVFFTKKNQALHDLIAGTLVVRKPGTLAIVADASEPPASKSAPSEAEPEPQPGQGTSRPAQSAPAAKRTADGTVCNHEGETGNYCTRCWAYLKPYDQ